MKTFRKLFLVISGAVIITLQVNAQNSNGSANQPTQKQNVANSASGNYVDKNNNGVCDNFENRPGTGRGVNFVDKNKDGICDNFENRSGKGRGINFVDKNKDGICDNRGNAGKNSGNQYRNCQGNQHRHGQGQGRKCGNYCRR